MTHPDAPIEVIRLLSMFVLCGIVWFASNGPSTKSAERIRDAKRKKTAAGKKRSNVRAKTLIDEGLKASSRKTKTKRPLPKKHKAPKLSMEDQRRADNWRFGRDNIQIVNTMPL